MSSKSRYEDDEDDREARDDDRDRDEEDDRGSRYKISNLISLFNKHNISLNTIFTYSKRVMILQVIHDNYEYCLYIPSKYEMYVDRSLGIPTYELADDDEQEDEQDTLFYNRLPIETLRRAKTSKSKSLSRFLPLVTESPIKMVYIDQRFVTYITRANEIDSLLLMSPLNYSGGYYIMTDLEFFFKNLMRLSDEFGKFERALNDAVYDRLTTELDTAKAAMAKAQKLLSTLDPKQEKIKFLHNLGHLNKFYNQDQTKEKARTLMIKARNNNLNKMFEIENITYVMKEFK